MVNFYRDMWPKRSETLAPLTALTSTNVPFKWTEEHDQQILGKKVTIIGSGATAVTILPSIADQGYFSIWDFS